MDGWWYSPEVVTGGRHTRLMGRITSKNSLFFVIIPLLRLTSKLFINILLLLTDEKSQLERGPMLSRLPFRPFLCLYES